MKEIHRISLEGENGLNISDRFDTYLGGYTCNEQYW